MKLTFLGTGTSYGVRRMDPTVLPIILPLA